MIRKKINEKAGRGPTSKRPTASVVRKLAQERRRIAQVRPPVSTNGSV